jgi:curved DNA-binding protein CbpA
MVIYDPKNDFYFLLGVDDVATDQEIKAAYRDRAKLYHPDGHRAPDLATRAMQSLNEAYRVLSDQALRRRYDETRAAHRIQSHEAEIQRRVKQELEKRSSTRRTKPEPPTTKKTVAKARPRIQKAQQRAAKVPVALVPKDKRGLFTIFADNKVNSLMHEDRPLEAMFYSISAAMLDAWLTPQPTKRRRRPR